MEIGFEIPFAVPSLNEWSKWHWRRQRKYRDQLSWNVRAALGYTPKNPIAKCLVVVERHSPRKLDWVNLYGSFKSLEDVLVVATPRNPAGLGLILNDDTDHVLSLTMLNVVCAAGEEKTRVRIISAEDVFG